MNTKLFNRNFNLVVIGQIISLFGNGILRFALPLYLLRETGSAALFGLVTACSFLPMIVLSFLGGILADRVNKRNIMVLLDFTTAFIILVFYFFLGNLPLVPLLIVVLMLLYGISGTYQPAVQASIPILVASENIMPACAIVNQISSLSGLLGPIIGGMLFGAFGIHSILIVSIVCFLFSAIMEIFIKMPFEKRNENIGILRIIKNDLGESIHYIKSSKPILFKIIGLITVLNLVLSAMLIVGLPVLVIDILKMSDELLGISQGVLALGGLCGGIFTGLFSKKLKLNHFPHFLFSCSFFVALTAIPLLLGAPNFISYIIITLTNFFIMALATIQSIQLIATVQTETPPELVGKVIALMMSLAMCAQPVGQALYGILFEQFADYSGVLFLIVAMITAIMSLVSKAIFKKAP